jgi:hypothetical protein
MTFFKKGIKGFEKANTCTEIEDPDRFECITKKEEHYRERQQFLRRKKKQCFRLGLLRVQFANWRQSLRHLAGRHNLKALSGIQVPQTDGNDR